MGELHRLKLRDLPEAPPTASVPHAWALLRAGMQITRGTLGEIVEMLDAGAPSADVFARIEILNTQLHACGSAVCFLKEADGTPGAA